MSARRYTTEFVITGDSSSGVKASRDLQRANADLTQQMQRAELQGESMAQSFESVTMHAQRLATVGGAVATAVGAMSVSQTRNIAEQSAMAKAVGVTVQNLQRWEFAAKAAGMQSGAMGDIFKDTAEKIGDFVNTGGGEAADLFEVLNLNIRDLMDLSPDQQLLAVARAFDEMGNQGAKIAFIEGLGNDATRLLPLLEDNAAALQEQFRIADQLSVAIPQSDVESLEAANQALNEMTALATGFANTMAINLAPSFVSLSSNAQSVVEYMGGMGDVVDDVADGTLMLATVLAGQLVGSMASAAAASIKKVQADRAVARQAGINAEAEAAAALATTRRTAAEKQTAMALLSTARLEAQATKGTAAHTFALQQLSVARERAATAAGAHTAAMAASTSAARAATAAQAGLATATNAAKGALALVGGPLGAAVLAGTGIYYFREELGLVSPVVQSATDRVDDMTSALDANSEAALKNAKAMLEAEQQFQQFRQAQLAMDVNRQRQIVADEQRQWDAVGGQQAFGMGERSESQQALQDLQVELMDTRNAIDAAGGSVTEIDEKLAQLEATTRQTTLSTLGSSEANKAAEKAAREAAAAAEKQATALVGIQQEMEPLLADHAEYVERLGVLDQALADGSITQEQYGELLRWSAEQYTRAATGAEDYEKQTESLISTYDSHNQKAEQLRDALEQINQRYRAGEIDGDQYARMVGGVRDEMQKLALESDPVAQEMARAWEEAANRIDETFADAFTGAFKSFDDFGDQLLDGFKRLLAELAYQATLKPIVVAFTGDMQGMMGIGGGSSGGGFGSTIGAAKNLFSKGSSLFGGGSAASAGGLYGNIATNAAASSGGLYANAATGSAIGTGAAGGGFLSSAASMAGPIAAMYAAAEMGNKLFESLGAYDALGIKTGGRSAEFLGQIAPIGGTLIGSALDALGIGGSPTKFSGRFGTTADAGSGTFEHQDDGRFYGQSALGYTGFINRGTERLQRAGTGSKDWAEELTNASVEMDNLVAALASSPAELRAMQSAVQGLETSSGNAADIIDFALKERPRAAIEAMTGDFGTFVQSLSGGIESVVQQAQAAQQAYSTVTAGLESINVEFGVTGPAAYTAAAEIAEFSGGLEQFGAQAQYYYENFVSEADKQEKAMNAAARSMGVFTANTGRVVTSTDQLTDLVEGLNLNTTAGRELYAAAMELAPALVEVEAGLERVRDRFSDMLNTAEGAAETAAQQARSAWGAFDSQSYDQQRQLLALLGDSEAALALERERELATLDEALRPHQERIWALEDEATAVNNYASALESANTFLASALDNIADWIDNRRATGGLPSENLQESQAQFARQLTLAESGDRDALQSITEYADRYLSAASGYYASGDGFQSVESDVMDALAALPDALSPEDYIAQDIKDALENSENLSSLPEMKDLAGEQLGALKSLIDEMRNSTDQFVSLDSNMISLRDSINALGVAREEVARIERERAAAEKAARERIEQERKAAAEVERYEQERQRLIDQQAKLSGLIDSIENSPSLAGWERQVDQLNRRDGTRTAVDSAFEKAASVLDLSAPLNEFNDQLSGIIANFRQDGSLYSAAAWEPVARILRAQSQLDNREDALAEIERQLAQLKRPDGSHADGNWNVAFDGYLAELHKGEMVVPAEQAAQLRNMPSRGLPMPDVPMPQFPQLGNADVLQALKDLGNENKQLRDDINRLLGDVKTNTGNTANAVASSADRAEQQRTAQLEEQRATTRAARLKGRTA